jgi:hypothetical protein
LRNENKWYKCLKTKSSEGAFDPIRNEIRKDMPENHEMRRTG